MNRALLRERLKKADVVLRGGEPLYQAPVRFSVDSKWVLVCCGKCVQVYSYKSHQAVCMLRHDSPVTAALLNPRNSLQLMVSLQSGEVAIWDFMDSVLLRTVSLGVPVWRLALRPGLQEPLLFLSVERGEGEVAVVGVASGALTERSPATPPSQQLKDAQQFFSTNRPRDIKFTHTGLHLVTCSGNGKKLIVYDFETEHQFRYKSRFGITTLATHPSQLCIATGNGRGEIKLWYNFAVRNCNETVTVLHWHAHAVADLCFTNDGSYLLSGGEEGVLVFWQLKTKHKSFRPRLGSAITKVTCSPDDACVAVSLHNNVIRLVSGLNSDLEGTLGGLRKATTFAPRKCGGGGGGGGGGGVRTGLVLCPNSKTLVLNSTPGLLQFYDTSSSSSSLSSELDVVRLNYVSRADTEPILPTTVDHVAFSPAGDWMVTVESRDNRKTAAERRMKFWNFVTEQQRYVQNTCVDPPHDKAVTSLTFQPSSPTFHRELSSAPGSTPSCVSSLVVTSGLDERFKLWVLVSGEDEEEEEEEEGEKKEERGGEEEGGGSREGSEQAKKKQPPSWACRSVGYYRKLSPVTTAFSHDGSLLAVNFSEAITIWDPYTCELKRTFTSPHRDETFRQVVFGCHQSSQYLLASATHHLHTWDLLTCRPLWRVGVSVSYLLADPFTHLAAAFVESDKARHLYLFEPCNATPLSIHTLPSGEQAQEVVGAAFIPETSDSKHPRQSSTTDPSSLFFITRDQLLYCLDTSADSADDDRPGPTPKSLQAESTSPTHKSFLEIFGQRKRPNGLYTTSTGNSDPASHLPASMKLLDAPPHVLPPPTILSMQFMRRLLPARITDSYHSNNSGSNTRQRQSSSPPPPPSSSGGGDDERGVASSSGEEEEDTPPKVAKRWRDDSSPHLPPTQSPGPAAELQVSSYHWLVHHFKSGDCT